MEKEKSLEVKCLYCTVNHNHLRKDNHRIGCELETYVNVLEFRGFVTEAKMLLEVASRLK